MFGVFAIDEPGSSVRALYATLSHTKTSSYDQNRKQTRTGPGNKEDIVFKCKTTWMLNWGGMLNIQSFDDIVQTTWNTTDWAYLFHLKNPLVPQHKVGVIK